jgi:hypothetical protein
VDRVRVRPGVRPLPGARRPGRGPVRAKADVRRRPDGLHAGQRRVPQGEVRYWLRVADGGASAGLGDIDGADVTISQSYETSAQVNKGELDGQKAFMQGKVKIAGKMLKMMQLRGPLEKVQTVLKTIDTEH